MAATLAMTGISRWPHTSALAVWHVAYWYGLFSHQRETYVWRGVVEVQLSDDDTGARYILEEMGRRAQNADDMETGQGSTDQRP
jgi:hypothetical protein